VHTISERVLIDDLYMKGGTVLFYDRGGPVLPTTTFNHYKSHCQWYKNLCHAEWSPKMAPMNSEVVKSQNEEIFVEDATSKNTVDIPI